MKLYKISALILALIFIFPFVCSEELYEEGFAEDRVIVMLSDSYVNGRSIAAIPNLGVAYSDIRPLNPATEAVGLNGSLHDNGIEGFSAEDTEVAPKSRIYLLKLEDTGVDAVENALQILRANPAVKTAEPDYYLQMLTTPNDPYYDSQYALQNILAPMAWNITSGSRETVVGIIDSGILGTHPDLIDNLWVNPNPGIGGYENDIHGYDFVNRTGGIPTDTHGHGTHLAGIVGAKTNNEEGIAGVNWNVSLAWLGIHAGGDSLSISAAIEALYYANDRNITITNNSYGTYTYSELLETAIREYNGLFIAAAGNYTNNNDTKPLYPSSFDLPNILSVTHSTSADKLSTTASYGLSSVDIAAPGVSVISTHISPLYKELSGSSHAAPHAAGVAALIKSIRSDFTPDQIINCIMSTARPVDALTSKLKSGGILDAYAAVLKAIDPNIVSIVPSYELNEIQVTINRELTRGEKLFTATYKADELIDVMLIPSSEEGEVYTFPSDLSKADTVTAFVWSGFDTIEPLCEALSLPLYP